MALISCSVSRRFKQKDVVDYYDTISQKYDSILKIKGVVAFGSIWFDFYFDDDATLEDIENAMDDMILFLSDEDILLAIREYYYDIDDSEDFKSTYPSMVIDYHVENEFKHKFSYRNSSIDYYDEKRKHQIKYQGWFKKLYD